MEEIDVFPGNETAARKVCESLNEIDKALAQAKVDDGEIITPESLAQFFHETYERLAPDFGYKTREASAKPWDTVPEQNKQLMIAVCREVLAKFVL